MVNFEILKSYGNLTVYPKGTVVFSQGDVHATLYYVNSGLMKAFYLSEDGREWVKSIVREGDLIGSLSSCIAQEPSGYSLVCLEKSYLLRISYAELRQSARNNLEIAQFAIDYLSLLAMKKEKREHDFLCLNAEKRFETLKNMEPELLVRVTQNDLARYLLG